MDKDGALPEEFVEDISFDGMIQALTIRSSRERGGIKEIKCPRLPNLYYLISARDIPGKNTLAGFSVPVLADRKVSYIGEPAAILAGPDIIKLEELAGLVEIVYDEEVPPPTDELIVSREYISGDPEKIFEENTNIVSGVYSTGIQEHWYAEPHGAVAAPSDAGLTIYTATQWPYHVKRSVAAILGCNDEKVTVNPTNVALPLDGKIISPSLVSCHAALAAHLTGRPVMLMLTREEDFLYSPKRNNSEIEIRSVLGEKGEILASDIRVKLDLGAEAVFEDEIIDQSCAGSLSLYDHSSYRISGRGIRSSIPPQGPMAGFGLSQGLFAMERHVSRIADALGQDPAEWRKNNFIKHSRIPDNGIVLNKNAILPELLDMAAAMSDYHRKWASYELLSQRREGLKTIPAAEPLRGIGIAAAFQGNGFIYNSKSGNGNCSMELTLEKDGSLEIKSSLIASSPGNYDHWRNLAKEILGVNPEMIRITANTDTAPDSGAGTLSRNIVQATKLIRLCCNAVREQRFRDPLPITVRRSAKVKPVDREVFAAAGSAVAVAEIEIDPVSLSPLVRGIWLAADGGKILSPGQARRTLRTGIIQALGWTCREKLFYKSGKIERKLYQNYNISSTTEIPPITVEFFKNDTDAPKGIGELPFSCIPAAYVQAVSQAMDHPFEKIPLFNTDIFDVQNARNHKLPEPDL